MQNEKEGAGVNCAGGTDTSDGGTLPDPDQNSNLRGLAEQFIASGALRWPQIVETGWPVSQLRALGLVTRQNEDLHKVAEQHGIKLAEYWVPSGALHEWIFATLNLRRQ